MTKHQQKTLLFFVLAKKAFQKRTDVQDYGPTCMTVK